MSDSEKVAAFDLLAEALTNRWADGRYSWWCGNPAGGDKRDTPTEAVADLLEWCGRWLKLRAKKGTP